MPISSLAAALLQWQVHPQSEEMRNRLKTPERRKISSENALRDTPWKFSSRSNPSGNIQ